ncbi:MULTISPECIES: hypothetical protein [unclassified Sphingomonas]|uniref:hypothetical protein n=1 Tax=unclassified Sphingomonas TaxID=196159 RepID=UPI0006FE2CA7|nr:MULTISPECIES: hypothetical protein [unclassified Sphingomonas]KQX19346.1 hypothetical protein ASD17_12445 [Sphingomonas sp. Root1294]KQY65549.1 hypothetical protein ASD39_15645 [Sphingomonas sp. Root50]KRB95151.1 hypothetical protein ASE22_04415 [Sphingomonas sp. Root720]
MIWTRSHRRDPRALVLADRHYSRQKPGTDQFVKAGSCAVFYAEVDGCAALWATVVQRFVGHAWPGAWECALFRNEGAGVASKLIRDAVAATLAHYGEPPTVGMITFVDPACVRKKRDPGHSFIIAGFRPIACTLKGLLVLQLEPDRMPAPAPLAFSAPSFLEEAA